MGKRARVYTGIYRYFTIPVYTLRNTRAAIHAHHLLEDGARLADRAALATLTTNLRRDG
jgi:hypothetical protein